MKKVAWLVVCLVVGSCLLGFTPATAMGGPAPKTPETKSGPAMMEKMMLVDDFESGSLKSPREWWTFDLTKSEIAGNGNYKGGEPLPVGNYSLLLSGPAKSWYAGGCGTYLAKEGADLSKYNTFQIDVYGNGLGSGTIKVELVDDDNKNWQVEQDSSKNYALIYDDKYSYEIKVDWSGWKRVSVPLADFIDDNPLVGDDIWNPQQTGGSGGLLQVQFICIAPSDKGKVNFNIDNIYLLTANQ
ncbi:hypothetical protein A2311_01940 [candidate division WOR-1 bacterium RIFOXYB2_FULL_48_7]|uniref:CBM11 domain-containing protein n=1 Tax=candidate division WOR-1 bacterium RIFOXYB2_FULL_48_7 TaxID=1802583 RepID=A0A1F4TM79_UNCSA|nr:MAG: hypothetical protein A2311_01940 [candidate division WOR-1 bacterium RIFOXYB2_FULL_48_7]